MIALVVAAGLGLLVWQLGGDRQGQQSRHGAEDDRAHRSVGAAESDRRNASPRSDDGVTSPEASTDEAGASEGGPQGDETSPPKPAPLGTLAAPSGDPEANRKYPPDSRPLAGARRQYLYPNAGMEESKTVANADESGADDQRPLHYVFKADRNSVVGDEPLTLTLAVYDGPPDSGAKRVPARIVEAEIRDTGPIVAVGIPLGKLAFNDEGRDGDAVPRDLVQTCRFVPADHGLYPDGGFYFARVVFAVQGHALTEAKVAFLHTGEERIPARFTGSFGDRVKDGSLVVSAELDVVRGGQFLVAANLYADSGAPLAHASNLVVLEQGKQRVELRFYGLILREAGVDGPYVVRYFRGHRTLPGQFPNREEIPKFEGEYRTAPYDVGEFSDTPWEDR